MSLKGTFPVLPTLFDDTGAVSERDFDAVIEFAIECGVDGVVFPGTASEVAFLTAEERARLVARLGKRIDGRVPFVCGASDPDPALARERAREGAEAGASAAMVMAPKSAGDVDGLVAFYGVVAEAPIPIMIQNAPPPHGAGLKPEDVAKVVARVPAIRYAKEETLPCGQNLTRLKAAAGPGLEAIFGGAGGRYITDELARGAAGTVPAVELADVHTALVHAFQAGDEPRARALFAASLPLLNFQAVFRMHMTKFVLKERGIITHTKVRAPDVGMDAGDVAELEKLLAEAVEANLFTVRPPMKVPA
ncbi:dihydrodipicolinate synthase family protein [Acuticoccus kandeliae]|uniref:dihydrodipicolinate synthase family protein n=1 Tax=Acuticoccus kandeliae TaxID=2073160 RepID=UPI000D3ECA8E|nr:dihydrodipicolinate synthase family protein [Acuticoccus kandeliae]